jgi:hypothetical protein
MGDMIARIAMTSGWAGIVINDDGIVVLGV